MCDGSRAVSGQREWQALEEIENKNGLAEAGPSSRRSPERCDTRRIDQNEEANRGNRRPRAGPMRNGILITRLFNASKDELNAMPQFNNDWLWTDKTPHLAGDQVRRVRNPRLSAGWSGLGIC
jgi:hypothetical protein